MANILWHLRDSANSTTKLIKIFIGWAMVIKSVVYGNFNLFIIYQLTNSFMILPNRNFISDKIIFFSIISNYTCNNAKEQ